MAASFDPALSLCLSLSSSVSLSNRTPSLDSKLPPPRRCGLGGGRRQSQSAACARNGVGAGHGIGVMSAGEIQVSREEAKGQCLALLSLVILADAGGSQRSSEPWSSPLAVSKGRRKGVGDEKKKQRSALVPMVPKTSQFDFQASCHSTH